MCLHALEVIKTALLHFSDKSQRMHLLESEVQKSHIEVATLKARNSTLERDILDKEKQINSLNMKCSYLEKVKSCI